ncbi:MAG TPA: TPM domain-containing protein, partial [Vicinamibacterales bacterium]|nr:TPM domain-containing protein [Vicinamibacterales bacterium]
MSSLRARVASIVCLLLFAATAHAESLAGIPNPRVRNGTWVTDTSGTLDPPVITLLNERASAFERDMGGEIAIVVIRSLEGLTIEEAAEKLFKMWGIGKKSRDNGLLFLWSTGDRRVRVEVGYGLEGALPDGKVGAILDQYVIPRFKANSFGEGVVDGVDALITAAKNEPLALASPSTESYDDAAEGWPLWLQGLGIAPFGIASLVAFRKWRRLHPRRCPQCRTRMNRLDDVQDDEHLSKGELAEEHIGSVDYDVWNCPSCAHHFTLRYPKWLSAYQNCPQCNNRTVQSTSETIEAATTSHSGSATVIEKCGFCTYTHEYTKTLPRISESS